MRRKKTTQYLIIAAISLIVGIAGAVVLGISLVGMSTPYKESKSKVSEVVDRTSSIAGGSVGNDIAKDRIGSGVYSVGDYLIRSFTSPDYLSLGRSDNEFASNLVVAITGSSDASLEEDIVSDLQDHSRMFVINKYAEEEDRSYAATGNISSDPGDSFTDCVVT